MMGVARLDPIADHVVFEHVTELALVVAVFGSGLAVEREVSRRSRRVIGLLLLVVMPLTIAAIAAFGAGVMGLPVTAALLLGAVLAPTDPVLAGDVGLGPPGGDDQGEPRLSLHTEAGINDGLASPFVLVGLFVATRGGTGWLGDWLLSDVLYAVGVAVVVGVTGGWLTAAAVTRLRARRLLSADLDGFFAPATALVIYGIAEALGSYGLLAVFAAGIAFRRYEFEHEIHARIHHGAETAGRVLELAVLLLLGSALTTAGLAVPGLAGWLLAPVVIFIVRPVLVLAVTGRRFLDVPGRLFLGFFGVRGVGGRRRVLRGGRGGQPRPAARGCPHRDVDDGRLRGRVGHGAWDRRHSTHPAAAGTLRRGLGVYAAERIVPTAWLLCGSGGRVGRPGRVGRWRAAGVG